MLCIVFCITYSYSTNIKTITFKNFSNTLISTARYSHDFKIYMLFVTSKLEYASLVWSPYYKVYNFTTSIT